MLVLIVSADPSLGSALELLLAGDARIHVAISPMAACDLLAEYDYTLVLLDPFLLAWRGLDVLEYAQQHGLRTPVVIIQLRTPEYAAALVRAAPPVELICTGTATPTMLSAIIKMYAARGPAANPS